MQILRQKIFGAKSKILGVTFPGAWQAKEAAKYGYDNEEDYKEVRGKYALKGALTPFTATYIKKKAERMDRDGKSTKEIRDYLENKGKYHSNARIAAGTAEALSMLTPLGSIVVPSGHLTAGINGLLDTDSGHRKKFKKTKKDKD